MDLSRLLHPRTIAVVGATDREGSYAGQTLLNLARLGYAGTVWGVNPGRSGAHGVPCYPSLRDLPSAPDAVVVAIPAAGVAAVVDEAGELGCGGVVAYGAGFGEIAAGEQLERALAEAAARHGLPVCGPNGNGIVALHERVALWGDALAPREPGRVALVSQSGNVAVNALATRRGLRLHTVVSCGNSVGLDPADWIAALAAEDGVGAIAAYLEGEGDGERLCEALAVCAERGVGVAVLKVGASKAGAIAAAAHTGAVAGDHRVFRALIEEAGAAWADDVHELLELAKALAVPGAHPIGHEREGVAVLTCSGGDSALAADECERIGLRLPSLSPATARRLRDLLPDAATVGNPLDYTALIWGQVDTLRDMIVTTGEDPAVDQVLVLYDQPAGIDGTSDQTWAAVREGIHAGAAGSRVPVAVASTLPELLDDEAAARFIAAGVPAIAGLRSGLACAAALRRPPGDPRRLREIGALAGRPAGNGSRWHAEHEAKQVLRDAGLPVVEGRLVESEDDAVAALAELGAPVALKLSAARLRHKSEIGALELDVAGEGELRSAHRRLAALRGDGSVAEAGEPAAAILVERMAAPGAELLVSVRTEGVAPNLVVAAGGLWTELLADAVVIPLPATPERVERAIRSLRAAPLFTGGRGRPALDLAAAAQLAADVGALLLDTGLELIELNPVLVHEEGATVVDALAA